MAADVRELLRHLDHDEVALVGHDRGARVATGFVKDHPTRSTGSPCWTTCAPR
jgi:haloacetate dehalogenase